MKVRGGAALMVALGCLAATAGAEEIEWRPVPQASLPPVQLGLPQGVAPASGVQQASFVPTPTRLPAVPAADAAPGDLVGPMPDLSRPPVLEESTFATAGLPVARKAPAAGAEPPVRLEIVHPPQHGVPPGPPPGEALYPFDTWDRQPPVPAGYEPNDFGGLPAEVALRGNVRVYASAEYLLWWFKGDRVPPLATTGPDPNPAEISPANLALPTTRVVIGNGTLDNEPHSGWRLTLGYWCDDEHTCGFETSLFSFPRRSHVEVASSNQFPLLARPFFRVNADNPGEATEVVARVGQSTGTVVVGNSSELWGVQPVFRTCLCSGCWNECYHYKVEGLAGLNYTQLTEELEILEALNVTQPGATPALPNGGRAFAFDHFLTQNQFFGGQVGLSAEAQYGRWTLGADAKLALGGVHQVVQIFGNQAQIDNVLGTRTFSGGLLALSTNSGHFRTDRFAVLPEFGLKVGYQFTDHLRLTLGYDVLYWSSVVRPGGQIDRNLDTTLIPNFRTADVPTGQAHPMVLMRETDFWAQGLTVGLEFRY